MARRMLLIGLLCVAASSVAGGQAVMPKLGPAQKPIRSMIITVPDGMREQFFGRLQQFASTHGFAIRIASTTPDGDHVGVDMSREDVEIHGASVWSPEEFDISFYQSGDHPVAPGSLDKMVGDLKDAVEDGARRHTFGSRVISFDPANTGKRGDMGGKSMGVGELLRLL
jgi:hypothetical protein